MLMLSELMPYLWIGVIVMAAAVELLTLKSAAVQLIPSGTAAFALSLAGIFSWIQVCVFIIISFILLLLRILSGTNPKKFMKKAHLDWTHNLHKLEGKTAIVVKEIDNCKNTGKVRINGELWEARTGSDDAVYESGIVVTVEEVDESNGVTLICSRDN